MPGRQRPGKLNRRRVVHKSTGGMLNSIPAPVDPVGNVPSSSLNTVAHLDPLPEKGRGIWKWATRGIEGEVRSLNGGKRLRGRCPHPRAPSALALSLDRERDTSGAEGGAS